MTRREILVGLLDSGIMNLPPESVKAERRFFLQDSGEVGVISAEPNILGHGTELAQILRFHEPHTRIVSAHPRRVWSDSWIRVIVSATSWTARPATPYWRAAACVNSPASIATSRCFSQGMIVGSGPGSPPVPGASGPSASIRFQRPV